VTARPAIGFRNVMGNNSADSFFEESQQGDYSNLVAQAECPPTRIESLSDSVQKSV
jgi:hypothetical protein